LFLFMAAYYLFIYKKVTIRPENATNIVLALLCAGFLLRLSAATLMEGHPFDINIFKSWATAAARNFTGFYAGPGSSDYPPLYIYVLFLVGKAAGLPAISPYFTLLLKLPSIAADMVTAMLIYRLARKYLSPEMGVLTPALYIFNPAVVINSTFWGQVDSFFTLLVFGAVYMLAEKKMGCSAVLFTAAVLMKPQGIIFLPVLFFGLVKQRNWAVVLKSGALAMLMALVIILPFSPPGDVLWIFRLYAGTVGEYPYASVNAFNFFSLLGQNYAPDAATLAVFSYHAWGILFIAVVTAGAGFIYHKGNGSLYSSAAALLLIAGVFTFSTRMHERYLFPAVALSILAFIYLKDKRLLWLWAGFSATSYSNTHYVLFQAGSGINSAAFSPVPVITALLNVLLFVYLAKVLYDIAVRKRIEPVSRLAQEPAQPGIARFK
jgi:Gpi18-like mannosyltransferase